MLKGQPIIVIVILIIISSGDKIEKNGMGGACSAYGGRGEA